MSEQPPLQGNIYSYQGHTPHIADDAWVAPGAMVIGRVFLGPRVSIWFNCVLRGDLGEIHVGEGSNIQDLSMVHIDGAEERPDGREVNTYIGKNVTVGHNCVIHSCVIGDNALIGMNAVVLSGAKIGEGAIVGAGAVVLEGMEIPPYSLAVGNPAQVKKTYPAGLAKLRTEGVAKVYQQRIERFKAGMKPV